MLVLLPEIALTEAFLRRFEDRFGAKPIVWHSSLKSTERRRAWRAIGSGEAQVVVGARSALFLPYANLGLIVVDEAHEVSFKQDDGVRYNARDVAVMRGHFEQIPVILASATPALESLQMAESGIYRKLELPEPVRRGEIARYPATRPDQGKARAWPLARPAPRRCAGRPAGERRAIAAVPQPARLCPADPVPQLRVSLPVPQLQRVAGRAPFHPAPRLPPLRPRHRPARNLPRLRRARLHGRLRPRRGAHRRRGARNLARGARGARHLRHARQPRACGRVRRAGRRAARST